MDTEKELYSLFFEEVVSVVISNIISAVPFLGLPVINWFFVQAVKYLAKAFWKEASIVGMFIRIDFQEGEKQQRYEEAVQDLEDAVWSGDEAAKEKARDEFKNTLRDLIRIDR